MTPESSGAATSDDRTTRCAPDATMQAAARTDVSGESEVSESIVIYHNPTVQQVAGRPRPSP